MYNRLSACKPVQNFNISSMYQKYFFTGEWQLKRNTTTTELRKWEKQKKKKKKERQEQEQEQKKRIQNILHFY